MGFQTRDPKILKFFEAYDKGATVGKAASVAKISEATAYRLLKAARDNGQRHLKDAPKESAPKSVEGANNGASYLKRKREAGQVGPIPYQYLTDEAKRALEDFGYFRLREFGRIATPWQVQAAVQIKDLLESEHKEYLVINCPPGVGKTTLLHDIICWLICRNRAVRLLLGSA